MAENSGKKACLIITTILLLFVALGLFVATLGLGGWGIIRAQVDNPCATRDNLTAVVGCEPQVSLLPSGEAVTVMRHVEWAYWLGGATGVGVLWAIIQTLGGVALIATIALYDKEKTSNKEEIPLDTLSPADQRTSTSSDQTDEEDHTDGILEEQTITVGPSKKTALKAKPLRPLTVGGTLALFFSLLFFILALLCLLWAIGISYDHTRRDDGSVVTYVAVEFIAAIALPICLFISVILISSVLDFITQGKVDLRMFIPRFLPVVKFVVGTDNKGQEKDYWVIEDTFYFEVPKHDYEKNSFRYSLDRSSATWFLNGIICLGIHLAIAYFVDFTLDTQTTITSPDRCDTIDSTYQCFIAGNLSNTRCGDEFFNGTIHCFKFLRFGVDYDIIMAVSSAYAFYLVAASAFTYLFSVVKVILQIKPSKWWGIGFLLIGILAIIGGIILAIFWFYGYAASEIEEILHFNIINLGQYFMVCAYMVIVGLLLVVAKWWEDVDKNKLGKKRKLVHYDDASPDDIKKAAGKAGDEHAADLEKKSGAAVQA